MAGSARGSVMPNPVAAAPGNEKDKALDLGAGPDREAVRQGLGHAPRRRRPRRPSRSSPPARSPSTSRSASAACPAAASSRSTARSPPARRRVALHAVANAQKAGGIAAFIDAEHALDPEYAKKLGVDTDALLVSQPDTGEQALEIADMLIRSGAHRHHRHRLGRRARAARRDRGRDGRQPRRPAGPADEPGAAQDHRRAQQHQAPRRSSSTSCARRSA